MTKFGRQICNKLVPGAEDPGWQANDVYYDGERVYYQIAAYTGDPTWKYCAGLAEAIYRDGYVFPNNGGVAGFDDFTHGLLLDYQQTGDTVSKNAIVLLSQKASFAADGTPLPWTADAYYSREVAYVIMAYLNAEAVGEPRRARLSDMIDQALGHIDQWFISKTAPFVRPFMVGITMQALIQAYDATQDPRIPPAIKTALDGLWPSMWDPTSQSFRYTNIETSTLSSSTPGYNTGGMQPAPDLNLLIAPAYAWMYYVTGDTKYRDQGDQIFAGGVTNAQNWLYLGKQFDQSYWWSPAYVAWRRAAQPGVAKAATTGTGTSPSVSTTSTSSTPTPTPTSTSTPTSTPTTTTTTTTSTEPAKNGKSIGKLRNLMERVR